MRYENKKDEFLFVGQDVWWYPHGDLGQKPHAAKVTEVNQHSLRLHVFSKVNKDLIIRDGVVHMSDTRLQSPDLKDQGGWDHTPQTKKLIELFCDPKVKKTA